MINLRPKTQEIKLAQSTHQMQLERDEKEAVSKLLEEDSSLGKDSDSVDSDLQKSRQSQKSGLNNTQGNLCTFMLENLQPVSEVKISSPNKSNDRQFAFVNNNQQSPNYSNIHQTFIPFNFNHTTNKTKIKVPKTTLKIMHPDGVNGFNVEELSPWKSQKNHSNLLYKKIWQYQQNEHGKQRFNKTGFGNNTSNVPSFRAANALNDDYYSSRSQIYVEINTNNKSGNVTQQEGRNCQFNQSHQQVKFSQISMAKIVLRRQDEIEQLKQKKQMDGREQKAAITRQFQTPQNIKQTNHIIPNIKYQSNYSNNINQPFDNKTPITIQKEQPRFSTSKENLQQHTRRDFLYVESVQNQMRNNITKPPTIRKQPLQQRHLLQQNSNSPDRNQQIADLKQKLSSNTVGDQKIYSVVNLSSQPTDKFYSSDFFDSQQLQDQIFSRAWRNLLYTQNHSGSKHHTSFKKNPLSQQTKFRKLRKIADILFQSSSAVEKSKKKILDEDKDKLLRRFLQRDDRKESKDKLNLTGKIAINQKSNEFCQLTNSKARSNSHMRFSQKTTDKY